MAGCCIRGRSWPCAAVVAVVVIVVAVGVGVGIGIGIGGKGLDGDVRMWLCRGVVGLCSGVVLCAQLYGGLHGDLGVLGEAVAAVGGRRAVAARVSGGVGVCCLRLQMDHPVSTRAKGEKGRERERKKENDRAFQ